MFTFYEERLLVVDVHEAVGAGVAVASERVPDQLLPRRLGDGDVVVLHPAALVRVVDVGPVVARIGLAFVHQHRVKPIGDLGETARLMLESPSAGTSSFISQVVPGRENDADLHHGFVRVH